MSPWVSEGAERDSDRTAEEAPELVRGSWGAAQVADDQRVRSGFPFPCKIIFHFTFSSFYITYKMFHFTQFLEPSVTLRPFVLWSFLTLILDITSLIFHCIQDCFTNPETVWSYRLNTGSSWAQSALEKCSSLSLNTQQLQTQQHFLASLI